MMCTFVKSILLVAFFGVILTCTLAQQNIPSFLCDGVPTDQYVRNVTDCRGWIKCTAHRPVSGFCPQNYFFDPFHQYCAKRENVDCYSCPNPTALLDYHPVPNSCNRFIRCLRGVAQEFICDEGLQFNKSTKQCETDVVCTSSESLQCPANLKPGEFYAINDAANCSIGLVCVGDPEPRKIECSETLHFNKVTLMCGNTENSGCTVTNETIASSTTTTTTTTTNTMPPENSVI